MADVIISKMVIVGAIFLIFKITKSLGRNPIRGGNPASDSILIADVKNICSSNEEDRFIENDVFVDINWIEIIKLIRV